MSLPSTTSLPDAELDSPRPKSRLVGKVLIAVLCLLLLVSGPLVFRAYRLRGIPVVDEPFDLVAAGTIAIEPEKNAFEYYGKAVAALRYGKGSASQKYDKALEGAWSEVEADVRTELDGNRSAIELYRQGAEQTEAVYIQPGDYTYATLLPVIQELRSLTKLTRLEAMRLEAEGDRKGAWELNRAILRSAQHLQRHGCYIEWLTGAALQRNGNESVVRWAENPQVDAELLRRALKDVAGLRAKAPPPSATLKSEYIIFQNMTAKLKSSEGWQELDVHLLPTASGSGWSKVEFSYGFLIGEPELSRRVGRLMWVNWMSQVDRPRFQRPRPGTRGLYPLNPSQPQPANLYAETQISEWLAKAKVLQMITPATESIVRAIDNQSARYGLLELTLALQLYAREHGGAYPDSLEALRPKYLAEIPADPFGKGEALRYRRESSPDGFTIWSIDADEVDNDGKIPFDGRTGDMLTRVPYQKPKADEESSRSSP